MDILVTWEVAKRMLPKKNPGESHLQIGKNFSKIKQIHFWINKNLQDYLIKTDSYSNAGFYFGNLGGLYLLRCGFVLFLSWRSKNYKLLYFTYGCDIKI